MSWEFDAVLQRLEGKMAWTVLYVPDTIAVGLGTNSRINVAATLDGHSFAGTLLPSRNGHYLVYNRQMKELCKKDQGDAVHVNIEIDSKPRVVAIPDDVRSALELSPEVQSHFMAMPYYLQREEINKIISAKTQTTRERRLAELMARLK